jgi:uroporphyrin-3 C-methyltransferase/uroporphyrinogen III methyltransferase/synthase
VLAREVSEQSKELQVKVGVLESRQQEAQSQQAALEQLYQDLSKNRDEWALSEIEQVLSTASQQLQLAGNVQGALIALGNADRSLSRSDKPQFITIRRAIALDTEKLKALPAVDLAGVALRLDNVIADVDTLPMLSDEKPALPAPPAPLRPKARAKATPAAPAQPMALGERMTETWRAWSREMWDDIRQLIRVRSVETPEALMLSPSESYFVRENLKLRLLNARLALLSRNESAFRDDLNTAQGMLLKYFDTRARATQAAQAGLRQVQANNLAIEMPTLADSLNAVRNYKAK